ncbi:tetratricopeptide repeat protein [Pseudenhygromyxa sp. WMMC2535]|uniref:tetratricopeptide repeat protein n=1 Tax=Pseudenhygromyxa sp. WMMC2535 TaxID=2712867 RepID=UPI0015540E33|nr:tetratricopeptide repeat protein [Pseudenhygromyxa sp. WMMC2535]NVB37470.1 tetratricopeptide repeat protein [Pseudenhygromyxa sp. WMMC2535]
MSHDLRASLNEAHAALERGDLNGALKVLDIASKAGVAADDPNFLHLQGLVAWAQGDADAAVANFTAALETEPDDPQVYIEAGELFADLMDFDAAEDVLRKLLERGELEPEPAAEAYLLLAQVRLAHEDPDPEESLELLDEVDPELRADPAWISMRAAALSELDRHAESIELLVAAVEREADEGSASELLYQLGLTQRQAGDDAAGTETLLELRRRDVAAVGVAADSPVPAEERDDLVRRLEEVLESLPDQILKLLATAPIAIQRWVGEDHIRAGADPRAAIYFEGTPAPDDDADGEAKLEGIVVFRDMLAASIDDDDELDDAMVEAIVEELDRFYDIDGLVPGM